MKHFIRIILSFSFSLNLIVNADDLPVSLTPPESPLPRINGPSVFGVRPGSEFLYTIPATGERPMRFAVIGLPKGLVLAEDTGQITGRLSHKGVYPVTLCATNNKGTTERTFRIVVSDQIALTPPMGWNDWNCWGASVDQDKILRAAHVLVASGLSHHGWTYINIDDSWQGKRGGVFNALQPNQKFPDMKLLCNEIHELGLKAGIYSTPWITSYAGCAGGSSDDPDGAWSVAFADKSYHRFGKYNFAKNDAKQWAEWGFDYLKFDWYPNDLEHVVEMSKALRKTKRDIVFSLSNTAPFDHATDWSEWANCWRTTCDIWDGWNENPEPGHEYEYGISEIAFSQDRWASYAGPGHWNDPDMLVVGDVGWSANLHPSRLTPDEQYSHISMWCMLSAPLLLGCNLEHMDSFTLGLLSNDEVLALDQDSLGKQAVRVATLGPVDIYMKNLEDGSSALGFFDRGEKLEQVTFNKLRYLGLIGSYHVRDLWRQKNLPDTQGVLNVSVKPHGVVLLKLTSLK